MTTIAILMHPRSHHNGKTKLRNGRRKELAKTFRFLDKFVSGKQQVAVLASPAPEAEECARMMAAHFDVEVTPCEGLLCDGRGGPVGDGCDCVDDFVIPKFGLVVAITSRGVAKRLAKRLSAEEKKNLVEIYSAGMAHLYLV